ncbi:hypothetical protein [Microbacterium sp. GXF7504]
MTTIAAKIVHFTGKASIDDDDYTAAIESAQFQPSASTETFADISGEDVPVAGGSSWVFALSGVQDWATATSLAHYLNDHEGEVVEATLEVPGGGVFTADVVCVAVPIGGASKAVPKFSVNLPSTKPEYTAPTPPPSS